MSDANEITIIDGFDADANDPTASPIHGTGKRFKDGGYYEFGEKVDERGREYAVLDRQQGWQKLEAGCPPEYLMQQLSGSRPPRPHVDEKDWPLNLNGKPEHPYKWTTFLRLLDIETGELATLWTNSVGGNIAVSLLSDQIGQMFKLNPNAIPVVALESRDMPTQYGGTKPRPHFRIAGWRERNNATTPALLAAPEQGSTAKLEQFSAAAETKTVSSPATNTPTTKPAPASETPPKQTTTRRGVTRFNSPELVRIKEPTLAEILDDDLPEDLK